MTTLARPAPTLSLNRQGLEEVRFVLGDITADLASRLTSLVRTELADRKVSAKTVEQVVAANVPGLLEEAFITELLMNRAAAEHRAVLLHVLSTVQVQSLGLGGRARTGRTAPATELDDADDDELTSEQAAKLLHVSRSHLNTLADSGALGEIRRTAGNHRRISKAALLAYKARSKDRQAKGLDAMMEASEKLGLYDE